MKPHPISNAPISNVRRVRPPRRSISSPTRIISPDRNVCARPRNDIATIDQATKSSPAGTLTPSGRPAESTIIRTKMRIMKPPAAKPANK